MKMLEDIYKNSKYKKIDTTSKLLREQVLEQAKNFKTSWVKMGRALYPVWRDKLFYAWGYEKFEYYISKEVGIKQQTAVKLLKSYFFVEQEEPDYLLKDYVDARQPTNLPGYEEVNLLRLAKGRKELTDEDYVSFKESIFEDGKPLAAARKDLTTLIKERQQIDLNEVREDRNALTLRKLLSALRSFKKDAETLKLLPNDIIKEAEKLMGRLEKEIQ